MGREGRREMVLGLGRRVVRTRTRFRIAVTTTSQGLCITGRHHRRCPKAIVRSMVRHRAAIIHQRALLVVLSVPFSFFSFLLCACWWVGGEVDLLRVSARLLCCVVLRCWCVSVCWRLFQWRLDSQRKIRRKTPDQEEEQERRSPKTNTQRPFVWWESGRRSATKKGNKKEDRARSKKEKDKDEK